jgi:hypothetical protein
MVRPAHIGQVSLYRQCAKIIKSIGRRFDAEDMSTNNELIEVINAARSEGTNVKSIRRQKYDPNNFYMTRTDGKQVGPVKCEGDTNELNRKFGEAQSYLSAMKNSPAKARAVA